MALILDLPLAALELRDAPPQPDPRQAALLFFASWFVWLLTTSALSFGVLWSLAGTRPRTLAMLSRAVQQLWPVFLAGGTYSALVMLGTFAMVLPGVFLLVVGYLVVTAAVAEPELGLEAALRRSLLLTTGHRLALLGVVLVLAASSRHRHSTSSLHHLYSFLALSRSVASRRAFSSFCAFSCSSSA